VQRDCAGGAARHPAVDRRGAQEGGLPRTPWALRGPVGIRLWPAAPQLGPAAQRAAHRAQSGGLLEDGVRGALRHRLPSPAAAIRAAEEL